MPRAPVAEFLHDPDQLHRREDLLAFFGPHADKYLLVYDRLHARANRAPGEKIRFNFLRGGGMSGPAFFVGPVWFFYRKMWLYGGILTALMLLLAVLPAFLSIGSLSLPISIGIAIVSKQIYVSDAINTIQKLRAANPTLSPQTLAHAGGVSKTAGWISGAIYALLVILGIGSMVSMILRGVNPG